MLFFVYHTDRPDAPGVRAATRDAHLAYIANFAALVAGPTLNADTGEMDGSVIVVELPDMDAAKDFVANDPYTKAGLFETSVVKPWKKVIFSNSG